MKEKDCLFCKIGAGSEPADVVWKNEEFVAIKNKYPKAPIHVLVMPIEHVSKATMVESIDEKFYGKLMKAVYTVVKDLNMENSGYKLVNNGGGYNHFDHEHIHVIGGSKTEPGGES